jgi:hypothetical protein
MVFSGYSGFPTTKTGRHDIAEILLKVALNTKKAINQSISQYYFGHYQNTSTFLLLRN